MRFLIGPYAGEFGWELCFWNPLARRKARHLREQNPGIQIAVAAPGASRDLYEFADEFIPVEVTPGTSECIHGACTSEPGGLAGFNQRWGPGDVTELARPEVWGPTRAKRDWRRLRALDCARGPVAVVALRGPKEYRGRVYPEKEWDRAAAGRLVRLLGDSGYAVAAVGGLDNYCPPGARDLRGEPLPVLRAVLSSAAVVIGPSSGPLHLAQLCEAPVVTWYNRPELQKIGSRLRYERLWNPFRAPVTFLDAGSPTAEEVFQAAKEYLRRV